MELFIEFNLVNDWKKSNHVLSGSITYSTGLIIQENVGEQSLQSPWWTFVRSKVMFEHNTVRPTVCLLVQWMLRFLVFTLHSLAALLLFSLGLLLIVLRRREGQTVTKTQNPAQLVWFDPVVRPWNKSLLQTSHKSQCTQEMLFGD